MKFRLLRADEIDCRISTVTEKGLSLLLYKDARCDMNILDETVGPENWERSHVVINGNLFCNVGIRCGDFWVTKQDVGTESYTEKEKGEASDSFKRACFNWGIGRELYTAPFMWVTNAMANIYQDNGRWVCRDRFIVTALEYDGRKIAFVEVENQKTKQRLSWGLRESDRKIAEGRISPEKALALGELCKEKGVSADIVCARYGVSSFTDMTEEQHLRAFTALSKSKGGSN